VSLVTALFGTFAVLAHRLTEADDLVLGVAAAGQTMHDLPNLVGHCVHFLPIRLRPRASMSVREFVKQARGTMLDAVDNQGVTFGTLLKHLKLKRDPARPPLISIAMNLDGAEEALKFDGLEVSSERIHRQAENFELFLNVVDDGRELVLQCSYNTRLFRDATMRTRMREYEALLRALPQMTDATLDALPLSGSAAPEATTAPIPEGSIHELIAKVAERHGHETALECGNEIWTYERLLKRADAIAAALQARGLGPGHFAGVCLRRTPELAATLLAVLKCGAAYVPLDPDLPATRLQFMFTDAQARLVICEKATADALGAEPKVFLEEMRNAVPAPVNVAVAPEAPAYAIYTSGSTGQPKGVVAHHRGVINCLTGTRARIGMEPGDALLAIATYAFDASVLEIFLPLLAGAKLVIATEEETQDGSLLARAIERHDITRIFTAPAAWRLLLGAGWEGKDDLVGISWAEPLTPDLAQALLPRLEQLWNLYGPTETTVWMLGCQVTDAEAPITIGTPIPNVHVHILDAQKRKVPCGATGELYIGGAGLAIGYLNRPELDAEKFVDDPFQGGKMYRSGDLARWTPEGEVQCLGRADHQVKLRGFRIELGEVESALKQCAGVEDCACGVRERAPGDARLVAWVKARPEDGITASELRQELREKLPTYMVPQHFRMLEAMPRLANGKLDRNALPDPFGHATPIEVDAAAVPRSATEDRIASIWRDVLGHENFTVNDRLLDVGGHSLLAVEVAIKVRESFGTKLLLREVMTDTLAQLARACTEGESTTVH
jgi:amino acid adenylation domain-containing protein